ncbi:MAG: ATP-binding cassette domain-containing protein, partial [Burkholderiales bacterium]
MRVSYVTGAPALDGVTLSFAPGEQIAVIGPSGAGKSTLLATLACALRPAAGSVRVLGIDPWSLPTAQLHALRRRLFLAPQLLPLPPHAFAVRAHVPLSGWPLDADALASYLSHIETLMGVNQ